MKWIQSEDEIENFQEKGLKCKKWSEIKEFWSAGKSSMYREQVRKVVCEVKWFWSTEEIEDFHEQGLEIDKWSEVKGIKVG